MRLDDTNPAKEEQEYIESILADVRWLNSGRDADADAAAADSPDVAPAGEDAAAAPWDGPVRYTSDYFAQIHACARALIESGDAYVCELSAEEMRATRGTLTAPGADSPFRGRPAAESLALFDAMTAGGRPAGSAVLRERRTPCATSSATTTRTARSACAAPAPRCT